MKKTYSLILIISFILLSLGAISQPPPPPANPQTGGTGNSPVGAPGAPIGNGTLILFALAAAYAARKVYMLRPSDDTL